MCVCVCAYVLTSTHTLHMIDVFSPVDKGL